MKRIPCSVLLALGLLAENGFCSTDWPNEPAGSQVVIDCPFSNNVCGMVNTYNTQAFASIANAPLSPSSVFDTHMAAGSSYGNGEWGLVLPNAREIYFGTWWATNSDFVGMCNGTNKMIFFRNTNDLDNNFLNWRRGENQPGQLVWYMQAAYDNCGHPGENGMCYTTQGDGTGFFAPNTGQNATVAQGSGWHRIELYLKASTTKTSRNGAMRMWLDGNLIANYPTINLTPSGFQDFVITHTWDGYTCTVPPYRDMSKAWHHYWDHLRISIPNGAEPPILPLAITSPLQTSAQVGKAYSATLGAENGKAPYGWTISAGSLPPGLTLNKTTGVLSGTPTTIGRSDFTVKVMDSSVPAAEATKAFTIIVSRPTGTGIGKREVTVNGLQLTAEPGKVKVTFRTTYDGAHSLSVYDLTGRQMWRHAGSGEAVWNHDGKLKEGIYIARLHQGSNNYSAKFVITK